MRGHRQCHTPHLPILHREDETLPRGYLCFAFISDPCIFFHSTHGQTSLLFAQPSPSLGRGEVRKDEDSAERNEDRKRSFDIEEPSPGCSAEFPLHPVENAGGEEGAERDADDTSTVEDGSTETEFVAFIPFTKEEKCSRVKSRFDKPQEEPRQKSSYKTV